MPRSRLLLSLVILAGLVVGLVPGALGAPPPAVPEEPVVVRFYYKDQAHLDAVAGQLDTWEVHDAEGYAVAAISPSEYRWLLDLGYRLEIDQEKTALLGIHAPLDPRFYYFDDYYTNANDRYVDTFLADVNMAYPDITELFDIGNAWEGENGGYNRDLWVLRITNEDPAYGDIADKPVFFFHAEMHAREVSTAELAITYIKYLTSGFNGEGGYGADPDVTWLVDWHTVYIEVMANPDGHVQNEMDTSAYRRKNMDNDDGCNDPDDWGVDLNRNHSFLWGCCGGSSGNPCSETYRGPTRGGEQETYYFQDFVMSVIPDQNGPNGDDEIPEAAPITTTGFLISLHSYDDSILWSWNLSGHPPAPNGDDLEDIARKMAAINPYYYPKGSLYSVDGTTRDWSYGKLGIPSYVFEVGPTSGSCYGFFPPYGCVYGLDGMPRNFWAENRPVFLYVHKATRQPYAILHGPDAQDLAVSPNPVPQGVPVDLSALIEDHRYGGDPLALVGAAEYFIDEPGAAGTGFAMDPQDGSWGETSETAVATVDTSSLAPGQHYILVHGQKQGTDYWGPFTAIFLDVEPPVQCDPVEILEVITQTDGCTVDYAVELTGTAPFDYAWDFGAFGSSTEATPTVAYGLPGTYGYTLTVDNCYGQYSDTAQGTVTVDCCVPPSNATLAYSPLDPLTGETVVFTGTAESNRPLTYTWDLGDGGTGSGAVVTHTYPVDGDYVVELEAANACGVAVATATVSVCEPVAEADFNWAPLAPVVNEWVAFHGTAEGSAPIVYTWDFADGGTGTGANTSHRYTAAGTYQVVMTATNCGGITSVATYPVQVWPAGGCEGVTITNVITQVAGCTVDFSATLAGDPPFTYLWAFGDGATSTDATPAHTYTQTGTYNATLDAWNCSGAGHDTSAFTVQVKCVVPQHWVYLPVIIK